jgi:hypothetical protein
MPSVRPFPSVTRRRVVVAILVLLLAVAGVYLWLNRSKSSASSGGTSRAIGVVQTVGPAPAYLSFTG